MVLLIQAKQQKVEWSMPVHLHVWRFISALSVWRIAGNCMLLCFVCLFKAFLSKVVVMQEVMAIWRPGDGNNVFQFAVKWVTVIISVLIQLLLKWQSIAGVALSPVTATEGDGFCSRLINSCCPDLRSWRAAALICCGGWRGNRNTKLSGDFVLHETVLHWPYIPWKLLCGFVLL